MRPLTVPSPSTIRAVTYAMGPHAAVETITPEVAQAMLDQNSRNRNLRPATVDRYVRDMLAGVWQMTGEAIKFAADGTLLDGQHRLAAIVKSGVTLQLLVVRNLPEAAQSVMDTGDKRTAADALTLLGERNTSLTAAAARLGIGVERGQLDGRAEVTHPEIIEYLESNPDLRDAVDFVRPLVRRTDCTPAVMAHSMLVLSRIDQMAAATFWIDAAEKVGLAAGDPVIALTNRFAEARRNRQRLTNEMYLSAIYRAWNARRSGQPMRVVKINSSAGGIVPIPVPR